ncbi:TRAP transporter substrate-binding protein [Chloroflexota bacterium]
MKRTILLVFMAVMLVTGLVVAGCGAPEPAKVIELNISTGMPAMEISTTGLINPFVASIEEATGGRVKLNTYVAGALGSAMEQWDMTRSGATDIGLSCQAYQRGLFPLTSVIELPFLGIASAEEGSRILWELYEKFPEIRAEYGEVKLLSITTYSPNQLYMADKRFSTLEDMDGLKIRATGAVQSEMLSLLGGTPVTMPAPEIYPSMDKGVIDGVFFALPGVYAFKLSEVTKYIAISDLFVGPFWIAMNKAKWDSLPSNVQDTIESLAEEKLSLESGRAWDVAAQRGLTMAKDAGIEVYDLPAGEIARWRKAVAPIYESWIAEMEGNGLPGRAVYEEASRLAQQY